MADATTAGEAGAHFLNSLDSEKAKSERPAVEAFIEAFGDPRAIGEMTPDDVAGYARGLEGGQESPGFEAVRAFLAYASRMAFTEQNLVLALQLGPSAGGERGDDAAAELGGVAYKMTIEGVATLERQLEELKAQRPGMAEQLRAAMADKDFRENAPLDAARDEQAQLEGRIRDIEGRLRHAVIIDPDEKRGRANVGSTVRLLNVDSNKEQTFHLVSATEVDPASGKISTESPVGLGVIDHRSGDEVTVKTPSGTVTFRLLDVQG